AYDLLICKSLSRAAATQEYLSYVADLPEIDCIEGLVELEKLSLVNRQRNQQGGIYFDILPLVREYAISGVDNIPLEKLEKMVIRVTEKYEPYGAEAVSLIEPIIGAPNLIALKDKVT